MVEKSKNRKRGSISEEDISTVLQRYTTATVLALLQEVDQFSDAKIDWNELVKKSSTGISNAREYQMLWRHLAYRHALLEKLEDGAEPLDDESDLEYELEAFPAVSSEASTEAAACVKVLIASGLQSDSSLPNSSTIEAPLIINIPSGHPSRNFSENSKPAYSMQGTNITIPVSVQKQPLPSVTSAEGLDANGSASGSLPPRKKRKPWSDAEDRELIAAVRKCGEGNWANILKGDFKGDRTASQLSQRWAIIRKRHGYLNLGGASLSSSQPSEARLAANRALSMALNMPIGNLTAACSIGGTNSNINSSSSVIPTVASEAPVGGSVSQSQHQPQHGSNPPPSRTGALGSTSKSRVTSKKTPTKSTYSPDSMVKAAAVAAGARIATQGDAASLIKSANAVHIMGPGGGSLIKSSLPGGSNPASATNLGSHTNVYIHTALAVAPLSSYPPAPSSAVQIGANQQVHGHAVKPAAPTGQLAPTSITTPSNVPSEQNNAATSSLVNEPLPKEEAKTSIETKAFSSSNVPKEQVQENQPSGSSSAPNGQLQEGQAAALPNPEAQQKNQVAADEKFKCSSDMETGGNDCEIIVGNQVADTQCANNNRMMELQAKEEGENQSELKKCECPNGNGEQDNLPSMSAEKLEGVSKEDD